MTKLARKCSAPLWLSEARAELKVSPEISLGADDGDERGLRRGQGLNAICWTGCLWRLGQVMLPLCSSVSCTVEWG